ncbi:M50 family metallopeptidase [Clostridium uliginosum]|uniref:Peptidase M50B-like n=1 Tax=Clostridium uliginosum TaxID=119641 RepID=A0A1I1IWC5_9CLOT|nr:M50 family metallopeptidase [Clostridium uliginosum]SFC40587.1 Peptidase M50B-like [Clostridium uliginosum]
MNVINILLNIILVCIFGQLATISHEFGHAIPALVFTKDTVKITLGDNTTKTKEINFSKLCIQIGRFQPFLGFVDSNRSKLTKWQRIFTSAGGPIISLVIGVSLIFISGIINYNLLKKLISFSAYYHILQFICTALPIIYPKWWLGYGGYPSDGYNIMSNIKGI